MWCDRRGSEERRVKHRLLNILTRTSLLLCITSLAVPFLATCGFGRFWMLQGPHSGYVFAFTRTDLCLQIARLTPDPERPATYQWRWLGGSLDFQGTGC